LVACPTVTFITLPTSWAPRIRLALSRLTIHHAAELQLRAERKAGAWLSQHLPA
jgi:hypothetical protein